jgi:ubiquinone/menaquinone biosynthesis C-methylase UbiE
LSSDRVDHDRLVLRVNEVYHDVEGRVYERIHPEIFLDEEERWRQFAGQLEDREDPLTIVDVGCGTGFVPLAIGPFLKETDRMICADISATMLEICRENVERQRFEGSYEFVKLNGSALSIDAPVDFVLMNSVLHHVPDISSFLADVAAVLVPGGHMAIAHEPNRRFYENTFLRGNRLAAMCVFTPARFAAELLRRLGILDSIRGVHARVSGRTREKIDIVDEVNRILLSDGTITRPLAQSEMTALVDVHSPTAGGYRPGRGIDVDDLLNHLSGFTVVHAESYAHLADLSSRNRVTRAYDRYLSRRFAGRGSTLFVVLRKGEE